jgi:hypothetical protein
VRFDSKIAIAVRDDLATWQRLNVTAFLASAVAGSDSALIGAPYEDADGRGYLPMFRQPVMVYEATAEELTRTYERAVGRGIPIAVFTEDLFATGHDEANRAAVKAVESAKLNLVGLAMHATRRDADKVLKGLRLHG